MPGPIDALLAAIDDDPAADQRFLVLADALSAAGDPRGELIAVQHALATEPPTRERRARENALLGGAWGSLAAHRPVIWAERWRLGFLEALRVDPSAASTREQRRRGRVDGSRAVAAIAALPDEPAARFLSSLAATFWGQAGPAPEVLRRLPHLRSLRLKGVQSIDDNQLAALLELDGLESLDVGNGLLTVPGIGRLPQQSSVRALSLGFARPFDDDHLAATAGLPWLERLRLHVAPVTDGGLRGLGDPITGLDLARCPAIGDGAFAALAGRPLTSLRIAARETIDGARLAELATGGLERLELEGLDALGAAVDAAAAHESLDALHLVASLRGTDVDVTGASLARVLALPALRALTLRTAGTMTGVLAASPPRLERLVFRVGAVPRPWLDAIAGWPLRELDLTALEGRTNGWVDNDAIARLSGLGDLEALALRQTAITDAATPHLSRFGSLTTLDLCQTAVTSQTLASLATLPRLRQLDLGWCTALTSLTALAGHPSLEWLDLGGAPVGDRHIAPLAEVPLLRSLDLERTAITDRGVASLVGLADTLVELNLTGCAISAACVESLSRFRHLRRLQVVNTGIDDTDAQRLRDALPGCRLSV